MNGSPSSAVLLGGAACIAAVGVAVGWQAASHLKQDTVSSDTAIGVAKDQLITELQQEVDKQKKLRAQERSGRTNAEREAREAIQKQQELSGYTYESVGHVQSCFNERRGTPRQSALVPASRGRIKFRTTIPPAALECVDQFSHLWVIFVFHENTNAIKSKRASFNAKIAPPRLGGQKVGLFSTRTPHRPNSIGLTVVKIEAVYGRYIEISGHDLVEGTPVLDVKPYVPMDFVPDHTVPDWINDPSDALPRPIEFAPLAIDNLARVVEQEKLRFYKNLVDIQAAIEQMLVLDIRSVHQGRGKADEEQLFSCRFDNLQIEFQTFESKILVVTCALYSSKSDSQ